MKVLLVSANTETMNMPVLPLGMSCVARAAEDAGHDVHQINLMTQPDALNGLIKTIEDHGPDVIGISVRNIDDQASEGVKFLLEPVKAIVDTCRSYSDAKIVLGGAGYSIFPQDALTYLDGDMGIQGEGERSFVLLLDALQNGGDISKIPGLFNRKGDVQNANKPVMNIDSLKLPEPDKQIWSLDRVTDQPLWLPIQTRRGCPLDCSYCSTSTIEGSVIRKRSIDTIIAAMRSYTSAGFDHYFFVDNTFNLPSGYAEDLCSRMIESDLRLKWRGIVHPWKIDEKLVEKMAASGCVEVSLGFESGSDVILENMHKRFKTEDVRTISNMFKSAGIGVMGFLLLGSPGETRQTVSESLAFVDSLELSAVKVTVGVRIYPYTALATHARAVGMIDEDDNLLMPTFYIEDGMKEWLRITARDFVKDRPNWFY